MPAEGLPLAVEASLNALLKVSTLSSYKIDGHGDNTVIVLRFTGSPPSDSSTRQGTYRRKPPSHVKRDRQRAEARKQSKESDKASDTNQSPCTLFLPTPEIKTQTMTLDQHRDSTPCTPRAARIAYDVDPVPVCVPSAEQSASQDVGQTTRIDLDAEIVQSESDVVDCQHETVCVEETFYCKYDPQQVKEYLGKMTDPSLQRRLRDKSRNRHFRKIVLDKRRKRLICDSDDIVLIYSCEDGEVDHWFIKQDHSRLMQDEITILANIDTWPSIRVRFKKERQQAMSELDHICDVVKHYLG